MGGVAYFWVDLTPPPPPPELPTNLVVSEIRSHGFKLAWTPPAGTSINYQMTIYRDVGRADPMGWFQAGGGGNQGAVSDVSEIIIDENDILLYPNRTYYINLVATVSGQQKDPVPSQVTTAAVIYELPPDINTALTYKYVTLTWGSGNPGTGANGTNNKIYILYDGGSGQIAGVFTTTAFTTNVWRPSIDAAVYFGQGPRLEDYGTSTSTFNDGNGNPVSRFFYLDSSYNAAVGGTGLIYVYLNPNLSNGRGQAWGYLDEFAEQPIFQQQSGSAATFSLPADTSYPPVATTAPPSNLAGFSTAPNSISLTWTAPDTTNTYSYQVVPYLASAPDTPLAWDTGYTGLVTRPGPDTSTITLVLGSGRITLQPGTSYKFMLVARLNDVSSTAVSVTVATGNTPETPPITNLSGASDNPRSVTLTWAPPDISQTYN
jgi:hypothetical protein